jgi:hypothetical protein
MATQVQFRGGTTTAHGSFTGAAREVTVDTDKDTVVIHDGSTAGGFPLLREDGSNSALSLGTAGSPSLKFTGDTNTGIYSPGADQVAISTGGSGRLFVDASGRVGVGNSLMSSFTGNAGDNLVVGAGASSEGITIYSGTTGQGSISFADGVVGNEAYRGFIAYNHTVDALQLVTAGSERLRITSDGKVGVGTSTVDAKMQIVDTGTAQIRIGYNTTNAFAKIGRTSGGIYEISSEEAGAQIRLQTSDSANTPVTALTIDRLQRVGIGTTSPSYVLDVRRASAGDVVAFTGSTDGGRPLKFVSADNGIFLGAQWTRDIGSGSGIHAWAINGSEKARIDSNGRLGLGTSSPSYIFETSQSGTGGVVVGASLAASGNGGPGRGTGLLFKAPGASSAVEVARIDGKQNSASPTANNASLNFMVADSGGTLQERITVNNSGNVGIGTTSVGAKLHIEDAGADAAKLRIAFDSTRYYDIFRGSVTNGGLLNFYGSQTGFTGYVFGGVDGERARIDSSGRLGLGTSTPSQLLEVHGTAAAGGIGINITNEGDGGSGTVPYAFINARLNPVRNGGEIRFGKEGTYGDAASSDSYMAFYTAVDDVNTERMRITSDGFVTNKTQYIDGLPAGGFTLAPNRATFTSSNGLPMRVNRDTSDGDLITFHQNSAQQGSISVSGSTVSYNGAHLSRWSQLPGGVERIDILRGTVLSNIDEMCAWGEEDNEQLNRMKVSDVEGDRNVSGVFQAWDDDDDTYTNDFYCAMTGDFVIRIAQGVTVERGDLLMSAGDGTAKPQDDDIIRSKTIAKVTSTHVSETYTDGSYCVPCVLMAC